MERVAPRQVLYEQQLPLAIESTSSRRIFFPEGGANYGPSGGGTNPNIVRIPINADDLLDPQESFLQFKFTNNTNTTIGPDIGVPFIRRLRIESGGSTLEDINEYGSLYAQLVSCQASQGGFSEATLTTSGSTGLNGTLSANTYAQTDGAVSTAVLGAIAGAGADQQAIADAKAAATTVIRDAIRVGSDAKTITIGGQHVPNTKIGAGDSVFYNLPLVSALLNCQKYLPLVFMNGGLTIEIEFDSAESCGVFAGAVNIPNAWTVSDVRYIAHMITLQRDFYDKLRMVMEGSGGVLQLAGTTYRHFQSSYPAGSNVSVPLPAKVKSMKGILFTEKNQADSNSATLFNVSNSLINGTNEYQLRVGSVVHPPTSVKINNAGNVVTNKGEAYQELRKLFGTLGDYTHGGVALNDQTYMAGDVDEDHAATGIAGTTIGRLNPKGLSLDSFPRTNLESGVNSADSNLSMSLELRSAGGPATVTRIDMWAMCDAIFYVNLDGSVSSSV